MGYNVISWGSTPQKSETILAGCSVLLKARRIYLVKNAHCKKQEFSWIDNLVFQKKTWEQLEKRIADKQMSETRDQEKF